MSWISKTWHDGPRVRLDSLRLGTRFVSIGGGEWVLDRAHSFDGLFVIARDDFKTLMLGSAEVVVVEREDDSQQGDEP